MKILLTNDDGVKSIGIKLLFDVLSPIHEVTIVAPLKEKNATSHSLTLRKPLKIKKIGPKIIGVSGTPTDCVILAIYNLLSHLPDVLISGINLGANLGDDVTYSGTVGAAFEGTIIGIKSAAISFFEPSKPDFYAAEKFVLKLIEKIKDIPEGMFLNINIPSDPKGVKITRLGRRDYIDIIEQKRNGYLIGGTRIELKNSGTDFEACKQGYISITPLRTDLTYYETIETLKKWKF
jgi:5'-nucleotidase